jgi:hypothetical protein
MHQSTTICDSLSVAGLCVETSGITGRITIQYELHGDRKGKGRLKRKRRMRLLLSEIKE